MPFLQVQKLLDAARNNDLVTLQSMANLPLEEAPDSNQMGEALQVAFEYERLDVIDYLCKISNANKPSQKSIEKVLGAAVKSLQWGLVEKLLKLKLDNSPSQEAVGKILKDYIKVTLGYHTDLQGLKLLCEEGLNKPTPKDISEAVITELTGSHNLNNKWEILTYLCCLTGEQKPDQKAIDSVLASAVKAQEWKLVEKLLKLKPDNSPSQEAVGKILKDYIKVTLGYHTDLQGLKLLCEEGLNKPTPKDISEAVITELTGSHNLNNKWEILTYLCCLTGEQKPDQKAIDSVLTSAVRDHQQELVKLLCELKTNNAPSKEAVSKALEVAARYHSLEIVQYLCGLKTAIAPGKEAVGEALKAAASSKSLVIVQYLCKLNTALAPSKDAVDEAVKAAAEAKSLEIVLYLCSLKTGIAPNKGAIEKSLNIIANFENLAQIKGNTSSKFTDAEETEFKEFSKQVKEHKEVDIESNLELLTKIQKIIESKSFNPTFAYKATVNKSPVAVKNKTDEPVTKSIPVNKVERPTISEPKKQLTKEELQFALLTAVKNYTNYHKNNENKKNVAVNRGQGVGFFSWLRHGAKGIATANDFYKSVNPDQSLSMADTLVKIKDFLNDSSRAYHHHSFTSYLADSLADKGLVTAHKAGHYNQKELVNNLEQWIKDNPELQQVNMQRI